MDAPLVHPHWINPKLSCKLILKLNRTSIPGQRECRRSRRRTQTDPRDTNHRSRASEVDEEEEEGAPTVASVAATAGIVVGGKRCNLVLSEEVLQEGAA